MTHYIVKFVCFTKVLFFVKYEMKERHKEETLDLVQVDQPCLCWLFSHLQLYLLDSVQYAAEHAAYCFLKPQQG